MLLLLLLLLWEGSSSQTLDVQARVSVQEGLCARVPCTFYYPSRFNSKPVYGYWFRVRTNVYHDTLVATNHPSQILKEQVRGRFHLLGDPRMNNCSLSITDAQFSDSGRYYFWVENGKEKYSYTRKPLSVTVTDLIQKPDMDVPAVLESGKSVTLKCAFPSSCGGSSTFKFSWKGAALSSQPETSGTSYSSEVSFIPGHQHHGTSLTCQVTLPGGHLSPERTIQLNVSYAVQSVTITISQDNRTTVWVPGKSSPLVIQEGGSLHLLCAAHSNPPATLTWMLGDQTLASSQSSDDGALSLDLPYLGPADGGVLTCHAQHPLGSKQVSLNFSVQYNSTLSQVPQKGMIVGVVFGAGVSSLLAPCLLLLLVKMLRKKSVAAAGESRGQVEDPKRPSWGNQSLHPISAAEDAAPTPDAPEDALDELHYSCLSFQGVKAREDHGPTDSLTEYSEIKFP
ncbi:sialic acid-binding Ig-like lectin 13 [Dromiciops gliroides]|uniref:sialic acid-binding Ig-like lectin 13 n=1 Tax=Dromiciops gliroides TaxID=33562 RepID=UPI001CC628D9|nr:sialic acid-binding Ig-like lectin 13 [Dromiciops gliroides]